MGLTAYAQEEKAKREAWREMSELRKRITELEEERDVRDLEQQAKGVQNLTKNNAETVQNYPWFVDAPPTLEYLYDVGFGMDSKTAIYYAEGLLQQAKALKEQK